VLRQPAAGRGATAPGRSGCRAQGRPAGRCRAPASDARCHRPRAGARGRPPRPRSSSPTAVRRRCGRPPRVLLALLRVTRCRIPRLCSHSGVPTTSLRETTLSVSRRRAIGGAGERRGR
jgi:hypothetical protein